MSKKHFYENCLSDELRRTVSDQLKKLPNEQLTLNDEVAVFRLKCADSVAAWSDAREVVQELEEKLRLQPTNEVFSNLLRAANAKLHIIGERMADDMKNQKDLVTSAVVADAKTREVVTENTLMLLINSVIELAHEYYNDGSSGDQTKISQFEDELRSRVVFQEADGQSLAIEYEFNEMTDSVPGPPVEATQQLLN